MKEPACGHLDAAGPPGDLAARFNLFFPETHTHGESMARLAQAVRRNQAAAVCLLPFCCTVEAEALGASIRLGDAQSGPRAAGFACASLADVLDLALMDFSSGRIAQVLWACGLLGRAGEPVALELSGPMTILNWLMDLGLVLGQWRKDEGLMAKALRRLAGELYRYALAAAQQDVAILSYADPVGALSILGPKRFAMLADVVIVPLLRRLRDDAAITACVHVCPKIACALVHVGLASWRDRALSHPMSYDEGCLATQSSGLLLGESCLKNSGYHLSQGVIKELVLA